MTKKAQESKQKQVSHGGGISGAVAIQEIPISKLNHNTEA